MSTPKLKLRLLNFKRADTQKEVLARFDMLIDCCLCLKVWCLDFFAFLE